MVPPFLGNSRDFDVSSLHSYLRLIYIKSSWSSCFQGIWPLFNLFSCSDFLPAHPASFTHNFSLGCKVFILKAIKNATGTSVIFPISISLIHFVFVLTSVPNVGERFTKIWAQLHTSVKMFGENDKFIKFFGNHIKSWNFIQFQRASTALHSNKQENGLKHKIHFAGRT